jgi:hypothetical protein
MRASLQAGNTPVLRGYVVRKERLDVAQIARDLGCTIDKKNDRYYFLPGN